MLFGNPESMDGGLEGLVRLAATEPPGGGAIRHWAARLGLTRTALRSAVLRAYHQTPAQLLERLRIRWARRQLSAGRRAAVEVGAEAGFASPRAFRSAFRRRQAIDPEAYGRLHGARRFEVVLPRGYRRAEALRYLGRDPRNVSERLDGSRFVFPLAVGGRGILAQVEVGQRRLVCHLRAPGRPPVAAARRAHRRLVRYFGLACHPGGFERRAARLPHGARLVRGRRGLRVLRTPSPYEGLIWVIAGQQVSLTVAFALRRRLMERVGEPLDGLRLLPDPAAVAALELAELRRLGWSQRKSEYLLAISRSIASGELDLDALGERPAPRIEKTLLGIRGLGPWSVNYLMMRAYGLADCVPVGDAGLTRSLQGHHGLERRPNAAETLDLMRPYAPDRSLATFHYWARLAD